MEQEVGMIGLKRCLATSITALVAGLLGFACQATAELRVCNQTVNLYNFAYGRAYDKKYRTEGWWLLPANTCIAVIKEPLGQVLASRYVYAYATDIYGNEALTGGTRMCVDKRKFVDLDSGDCWLRGKQEVRFKAIDVGSRQDWTVFIRAR